MIVRAEREADVGSPDEARLVEGLRGRGLVVYPPPLAPDSERS